MALGMSISWCAMRKKQRRCDRCCLYYSEDLKQCHHCGRLDDDQLEVLLKGHNMGLSNSVTLGRCFIVIGLAVGGLLLFVL
ncbi:hypothetical protein EDC56_1734 [Sinobacterium caligoides]|uniref:Uncharacterized protein n=1 Tax=Sinobacterium caligoides TaxID=933926 RepID=A0A3N2DPR0_9GAMM|nr:hypothetical protein EDC56_1734 [Sinobacterium caligoides]